MVDICLELSDELIRTYEQRAALAGRSAEDLMRDVIERSVPATGGDLDLSDSILADEPIVKAAEIESEYRRLGYQLGWRFITCPQENAALAKVLLVSLNPAGRETHGPAWSQPEGSAYRVESWDGRPAGAAPLQRQVQRMYDMLGVDDREVFSAHFVPFRSPSWNELDRKEDAERFAIGLWRWLIPTVRFERIVCLGKDQPAHSIASLVDARFERSFAVGWGAVQADRYRLPDGRPLIALPHLSRFGIFGRPEGEQSLRDLFDVG